MRTGGPQTLFWPIGRQVLETQAFTAQLGQIGAIDRLDEALAAVQLILTENAEVYPVLNGYEKTRLAKTKAVDEVPPLNIWFVIDDDNEHVLLLYVESVPAAD